MLQYVLDFDEKYNQEQFQQFIVLPRGVQNLILDHAVQNNPTTLRLVNKSFRKYVDAHNYARVEYSRVLQATSSHFVKDTAVYRKARAYLISIIPDVSVLGHLVSDEYYTADRISRCAMLNAPLVDAFCRLYERSVDSEARNSLRDKMIYIMIRARLLNYSHMNVVIPDDLKKITYPVVVSNYTFKEREVTLALKTGLTITYSSLRQRNTMLEYVGKRLSFTKTSWGKFLKEATKGAIKDVLDAYVRHNDRMYDTVIGWTKLEEEEQKKKKRRLV